MKLLLKVAGDASEGVSSREREWGEEKLCSSFPPAVPQAGQNKSPLCGGTDNASHPFPAAEIPSTWVPGWPNAHPPNTALPQLTPSPQL